MREIKFRAWHKIDNKFCEGKISNMFSWIDDGQPIELMQYTGLKDKNGVEIYEGDIVKIGIDFGYGIEALFGEVIFKDCTFIYRNKSQGDTSLFGIDSNSLCEVVGNIYENPELLKD